MGAYWTLMNICKKQWRQLNNGYPTRNIKYIYISSVSTNACDKQALKLHIGNGARRCNHRLVDRIVLDISQSALQYVRPPSPANPTHIIFSVSSSEHRDIIYAGKLLFFISLNTKNTINKYTQCIFIYGNNRCKLLCIHCYTAIKWIHISA